MPFTAEADKGWSFGVLAATLPSMRKMQNQREWSQAMAIFKLGFFAVAAFMSAVAIFVGCVSMLAFLKSGAISLSYLSGGLPVSETVSRATDSERFWKLFLLIGLAPAMVGAVVLKYSVRRIRSLT